MVCRSMGLGPRWTAVFFAFSGRSCSVQKIDSIPTTRYDAQRSCVPVQSAAVIRGGSRRSQRRSRADRLATDTNTALAAQLAQNNTAAGAIAPVVDRPEPRGRRRAPCRDRRVYGFSPTPVKYLGEVTVACDRRMLKSDSNVRRLLRPNTRRAGCRARPVRHSPPSGAADRVVRALQ